MAEEVKKEGAKAGFEQKAFEALERDFQEVELLCPHGPVKLFCLQGSNQDCADNQHRQGSTRFLLSFASRYYIGATGQVLQELQGDRSLDRFRVEYEKLHRALKKSHGN